MHNDPFMEQVTLLLYIPTLFLFLYSYMDDFYSRGPQSSGFY